MDFLQAQEKAKKATYEERFKMLRGNDEMEKLAAISYFDTNNLLETLKDPNATVRMNALSQICRRDDFYDLARSHKEVVALAYDASPGIRQEVMNIINQYSKGFAYAKDGGNIACDTAYWEFVRTAEKLAVDPVPEIAASAEAALEEHYNRYPHTRPKEQELARDSTKYFGNDKGGMDI